MTKRKKLSDICKTVEWDSAQAEWSRELFLCIHRILVTKRSRWISTDPSGTLLFTRGPFWCLYPLHILSEQATRILESNPVKALDTLLNVLEILQWYDSAEFHGVGEVS